MEALRIPGLPPLCKRQHNKSNPQGNIPSLIPFFPPDQVPLRAKGRASTVRTKETWAQVCAHRAFHTHWELRERRQC